MERKHLAIIEVRDPKEIKPGLSKLCFTATNGDKQALWYFTFNRDLFASLQAGQGKDIEADVDVAEPRTVNGQTYIDRKITQVYIDGQPVAKPAPRRPRSAGESPEARASIEAQCAYKGVVDMICAGIMKGDNPLAKLACKWATQKLEAQTAK